MSFLNSPQVRAGLVEINELQEEIYKDAMAFPAMSQEDQYEHLTKLENLLEKQRIMYTRVSLSDDPEALQIKENIVNAAKMLGFPGSVDPGDLFNNMHMTIKNLRKMVDRGLDK